MRSVIAISTLALLLTSSSAHAAPRNCLVPAVFSTAAGVGMATTIVGGVVTLDVLTRDLGPRRGLIVVGAGSGVALAAGIGTAISSPGCPVWRRAITTGVLWSAAAVGPLVPFGVISTAKNEVGVALGAFFGLIIGGATAITLSTLAGIQTRKLYRAHLTPLVAGNPGIGVGGTF